MIYCQDCGQKLNPSKRDTWQSLWIELGNGLRSVPTTWAECAVSFGKDALDNENFFEAIEYLLSALESSENDKSTSVIFILLGQCWQKLKISDKAMDCFSKAIQLHPDNIAYNNRAFLLSQMKDEKRAIPDFVASLEIEGNDANIWWALGMAYENTQQYTLAKAAYLKAI